MFPVWSSELNWPGLPKVSKMLTPAQLRCRATPVLHKSGAAQLRCRVNPAPRGYCLLYFSRSFLRYRKDDRKLPFLSAYWKPGEVKKELLKPL